MLIYKAYKFATNAHKDQKRKYTGEPYIEHPLQVMFKAIESGITDINMLTACLLHDVIEDCGVSHKELLHQFGSGIADLVLELTNYSKEFNVQANRTERHRLDLEKIKKISPSAKIIKLVDRICNLRDCPLDNEDCVGFLKKRYLRESQQLLDVLLDTHNKLEVELQDIICKLGNKISIVVWPTG